MGEPLSYEVVVVGGGPAGLTTGLYTTRLGHRTAVFETEGGRHAKASHVHNLYGVSEDVSGADLSRLAGRQFEEYGGDLFPDTVEAVSEIGGAHGDDGTSGDDGGPSDGGTSGDDGGPSDDGIPGDDGGSGSARFRIDATRSTVLADRVVFATGFTDRPPDVPGLRRFTGRGLHYCLHCDAYSLGDGRAFVLGHDESAARVALMLLNFTADVDVLLDGRDPAWDEDTERQVAAHPVDRIDAHVVSAFPEGRAAGDDARGGRGDDGGGAGDHEPWLGGFEFGDGTEREYVGGFAMYGREYDADLAADLGCDLRDDGAIAVDDDRETSVDGVYAVGDVTHGQNQTPIAMGDAAYAGIAIHQDLRRYPLSPAELDEREGDPDADHDGADDPDVADLTADDLEVPAAPADLRARMRSLRDREVHAGLREPASDR